MRASAVLAYHHTRPFWPVHIVVIPKKHIASFVTLSADDMPIFLEMVEVMKTLSAKVTAEHGAARILTNLGRYQDSKHLHFHIIERRAAAVASTLRSPHKRSAMRG